MHSKCCARFSLPPQSALCSLESHYRPAKPQLSNNNNLTLSIYLRVCVGESLLKLAFGLNSGILHVFEVLAHILHLVLEVVQIRILPRLLLNHL